MKTLLEKIHAHESKGSISDLVFPVSNTYDFADKKEVIFINTGDVHEGKFLHQTFSDVKKLPGQAKKAIEPGDILFSEIRPKNRHFALVDFDAREYVVSTKLIVLKTKEGVDPQFAYTVLTADKNLKEFQNIAESRSGTFPQITFDSIADFEVRLLDLPMQKRIAEVIGTYSKKIANNEKIIEMTNLMLDAMFQEWFIDFRFPGHEGIKLIASDIGKIPSGWFVGDITDLTQRLSAQRVYREEELDDSGLIPVYDQSSKGIIGYHNESPTFRATISEPMLIFGDHTCRTQLVSESFSIGPNTIPLKEKNGYSSLFTFLAIKDFIEQREYKRHWNELVSIKFAIPNQELVKLFTNKIHSLVEKAFLCEKENILLKQSKEQLLEKLI